MFSTGIPWEQEPEYLAACRTDLHPGEPNTYIPPRNTGASPTDVTGFQIGSAQWNIDNLPNVCYMLNPPIEWDVFRKQPQPAQKRDESGELMWERCPWPGTAPRPLLDFPILRNIDTICTEVEWEWLEYIMRLDPRLGWDDIEMRMEYVGARAAHHHTIDTASRNVITQAFHAKNKFINALQTRRSRGRAGFAIVSWSVRSRLSKVNKIRVEVLKQLSADQIANNTTRGSTPGIFNPLLPDTPSNRVPRRRRHGNPDNSQNEQLDLQPERPLRVLAAAHLGDPLIVPSTQHNRMPQAPPPSLTPMAINSTGRSDDGPSSPKGEPANVDIIDLTQDDEMDADSKPFASNNAPTSNPFADLHMYAQQQSLWEPNRMQHAHLNWPPTGIPTRTQNLSSSFPDYPTLPPLVLTPMGPPTFGAGAPTAPGSAAGNGSSWGQGWGYYYYNDGPAPFTSEQNRQESPGRRPTHRAPHPHPF